MVWYFSVVSVANFFSLNYRNIFVSPFFNFIFYFNIWSRRMNIFSMFAVPFTRVRTFFFKISIVRNDWFSCNIIWTQCQARNPLLFANNTRMTILWSSGMETEGWLTLLHIKPGLFTLLSVGSTNGKMRSICGQHAIQHTKW